MQTNLLSLLILIFLFGCVSYGETTKSDFSPLKQITCEEKPKEIYLFMENEKVDFEYERIGLIEVQGGQYVSLTEVTNELKFKAWENCANGILNVSQGNTIRASGTAFVDESEDLYSSKVLTGVAVRVNLTESFKTEHASKAVSLDFTEEVDQRKTKESKKANTQATVSIIAGVVGLIVIIIAA
ncbi:hypothetical protein [Ekhidna sp.]|uniref:hypothetical protein n=1 Tax=Ekhidna sp. TaxID=2608089 RepID=UPI00329711FF